MGDWSLWHSTPTEDIRDRSMWLWETGACGVPHLQRTLETGACGYGRLELVVLHTYREHWRLEHVVMGDWSLWCSTPTEDIRDRSMWLWETGACGVPHLQRTLETGACGYGRLELVALHTYRGHWRLEHVVMGD